MSLMCFYTHTKFTVLSQPKLPVFGLWGKKQKPLCCIQTDKWI